MRHPLDPAKQHEAADRLGRMVARGEVSPETASQTMRAIVAVARENAPNVDAKGLRTRLVWTARDAKQEEALAMVRRAREQERALAEAALRAMRDGHTERQVWQVMLDAAKAMQPPPPVEIGDAALRLARWRLKHG
jgi:Xaa-Pro aminopeptidase